MTLKLLSIGNKVINLSQIDRIYHERTVNVDDMTDYEYAVLAEVDHQDFILAVTGKDKEKALQLAEQLTMVQLRINNASIRN